MYSFSYIIWLQLAAEFGVSEHGISDEVRWK